MSTPPARTSGWTQPNLPGTDRNLQTVHRKFDSGRRPATGPALTTPDRSPAGGSTTPPAAGAEEHPMVLPAAPSDAPANAGAAAQDAVEQAHERRLAKQWEDVVDRLCRDFAPSGGADRKAVLTQIAQQRAQLDTATVRDYLPVLVDRAVRRIYAPDEPVPRGPGSLTG